MQRYSFYVILRRFGGIKCGKKRLGSPTGDSWAGRRGAAGPATGAEKMRGGDLPVAAPPLPAPCLRLHSALDA